MAFLNRRLHRHASKTCQGGIFPTDFVEGAPVCTCSQKANTSDSFTNLVYAVTRTLLAMINETYRLQLGVEFEHVFVFEEPLLKQQLVADGVRTHIIKDTSREQRLELGQQDSRYGHYQSWALTMYSPGHTPPQVPHSTPNMHL